MESIFVDELGQEIFEKEMFQILVADPMMGAIDVDWRDFFPYLKWVPHSRLENKINRISHRKMAVTRALIQQQRTRMASGEVLHPSTSAIYPLSSTLKRSVLGRTRTVT